MTPKSGVPLSWFPSKPTFRKYSILILHASCTSALSSVFYFQVFLFFLENQSPLSCDLIYTEGKRHFYFRLFSLDCPSPSPPLSAPLPTSGGPTGKPQLPGISIWSFKYSLGNWTTLSDGAGLKEYWPKNAAGLNANSQIWKPTNWSRNNQNF